MSVSCVTSKVEGFLPVLRLISSSLVDAVPSKTPTLHRKWMELLCTQKKVGEGPETRLAAIRRFMCPF